MICCDSEIISSHLGGLHLLLEGWHSRHHQVFIRGEVCLGWVTANGWMDAWFPPTAILYAGLADIGWLLFWGGSEWLRCCWLLPLHLPFALDVPLPHGNELLSPMVVRMWVAFAAVCYIHWVQAA